MTRNTPSTDADGAPIHLNAPVGGLTRRDALRLGAMSAVGGALLVTGCGAGSDRLGLAGAGGSTTTTGPGAPPRGGELGQIDVIQASDGVLTTAITAAVGSTTINGETVSQAYTYNGLFPGATWRVRPGDTFRVALTNDLDGFTNLHWHGMHVSPNDNADNVFLQINPGETFDYEVAVPEDHPPGLYWYHPHYHTQVNEQVYGGMSGLIVVEGGWREVPGIAEATERLMALKTVVVADGQVATESSATDELWTINGQVNPTITVRPGERQLWSIANLSNDAFFRLALDGHQMTVVATDGVGVTNAFEVDEWVLPPASRVEVLVDPGDPGSYTFRNRFYNEGVFGFAGRALATMVVEGAPVTGLPPVPGVIQEGLEDLSAIEPDVRRTLVFNSNNLSTGGVEDFDVSWLICDLSFNAGRVDVEAKLGQMEEWTIRNIDVEDHPFHIHQNDLQVTEINGVVQPFTGYRDTVTAPRGGQIKIRQRYTDFVGKWVYHCHILFHEDHGMMGTIEVS